MSVLIAESGSSKTDWRWIRPDGTPVELSTRGINPSLEDLQALGQDPMLEPLRDWTPDQVHFYGAGCADEQVNKQMTAMLQGLFPEAAVGVYSDLLAAARVLFGHKPGIACILGTGSNSCLYAEGKVQANVLSLGYLLGDEGGGVSIGKRLLKDYLRGNMPADIAEHLRQTLQMDRAAIYERIYRMPYPNRFLASMVTHVAEYRHTSYLQHLVEREFQAFFKQCIRAYPDYAAYSIGFVGSIAFHFSDALRAVAHAEGMTCEHIIHRPIDALVDFHHSSHKDLTT
ncbi:N-acetylglucosamine kinase [Marinoscillum furvescens]|uniref:N-acetylglucosamine kinase-like BadF-type ATPase n=1 Tax=Marinoscillum furvescens DSM 4134 TaxID=1122208 RepID=A0A3D9L8G9_MARFU|nr:N-acetylglucosamine kinase [Marinoscillum furvescens]REE01167.1 hypothetical protein C7460_104187 [Marinoscillum furvescens DSM 4134]